MQHDKATARQSVIHNFDALLALVAGLLVGAAILFAAFLPAGLGLAALPLGALGQALYCLHRRRRHRPFTIDVFSERASVAVLERGEGQRSSIGNRVLLLLASRESHTSRRG